MKKLLTRTVAKTALAAINTTEAITTKAAGYVKQKLEHHAHPPPLEEQLELFIQQSGIDPNQAKQWLSK